MKKKTTVHIISVCIFILSVTLATMYVVSPKTEENIKETTATVYLSPASVVGPPPSVGETFTLDVNVTNITDLYGWSVGLTWNSSILNCTYFTYDYSWFGPSTDVVAAPGTINNTAGQIHPPYGASLTTDYGVTGNGTLAEVEFLVVGYGTTSIDIIFDALNSSELPIPFSVVNGSFTLPPPHGPIAVKTHTPDPPYAKLLTTFSASDSEPGFNGTAEVPIASYAWDFGDGNTTTVTEPIIYHNYTAAGNYTVVLNVTCQYDPVLAAKGLMSDTTAQNITVQPPVSRVFVYPASVVGPPPKVGETFNVSIKIADVSDLYAWGIGVAWNSSVLECLNFTYDYSFLGPEADVLTVEGTINNTLGVIFPPYAATLFTVTGVNDSGTLANVTFRVKDYGTSSITLNHTYGEYHGIELMNSIDPLPSIPFTVTDGYFELFEDTTAPTISDVVQSPTKTEVDADEAVTVTATVTDVGWGIQTVLLRYSTDNSTFTNVTMTLSTGNNYTGQIPSQAADTYVSYKIFANDKAGNSYETTLHWYRVKTEQLPSNLWLWITIGVAIPVIIILVAVYLMRRKRA